MEKLNVKGSHYDMGYQHGHLLKCECLENIRAFLNFGERLGCSLDQLIEKWKIMESHIPKEYIEELQGIADGAEVSYNEIAATYTAFECLFILNCFGIVAWDSATSNGKLIHVRSTDLPFIIKDPETGKYAHENNVLMVRNPDNKNASLIPTVAGLLNCGGGINEKGIGLGCQVSGCNDQTIKGSPVIFKKQMVMDQTSTAEEAINILNTKRTLGYNYIMSDSKNPIGYAIETTSNHSYIGTWDDPIESKKPFWPIDHVVRRTNFFIDPEISAIQRDRYHPGGIIGFIKAISSLGAISKNQEKFTFFSPDLLFPVWCNYREVSKEIQKRWGLLDLQNTMSIIRNVYNGKTNILFPIMKKISKGHGYLESWNQWVAYPETGDMLVSFASRDKYASKNPVHHCNLFKLLKSK